MVMYHIVVGTYKKTKHLFWAGSSIFGARWMAGGGIKVPRVSRGKVS